jgi:hypothetical protein
MEPDGRRELHFNPKRHPRHNGAYDENNKYRGTIATIGRGEVKSAMTARRRYCQVTVE